MNVILTEKELERVIDALSDNKRRLLAEVKKKEKEDDLSIIVNAIVDNTLKPMIKLERYLKSLQEETVESEIERIKGRL